ncbi:unnamed protein product [Urochloa humidicola]
MTPTLPVMVVLVLLCVVVPTQSTEAARARQFNMLWSPGCEAKVVIGINGQFQGSTIHARAGGTIYVELNNVHHTEGVVIHWHGIRQVDETLLAGGSEGITKCVVSAEETFTCRFVVDMQPGTYFYHGYLLGVVRLTGVFYGSLIVTKNDCDLAAPQQHRDYWYRDGQVMFNIFPLAVARVPLLFLHDL